MTQNGTEVKLEVLDLNNFNVYIKEEPKIEHLEEVNNTVYQDIVNNDHNCDIKIEEINIKTEFVNNEVNESYHFDDLNESKIDSLHNSHYDPFSDEISINIGTKSMECSHKFSEIINDELSIENSDSDTDVQSNENIEIGGEFGPVQGRKKIYPYTGKSGINDAFVALLQNGSPYDFFSVFIDDKIWNTIVDQTNHYATQCLTESIDISNHSRKHAWVPTTKTEIKQLFGLLGYMGLVRMPTMRDYWSTDKLYHNNVAPQTMSRNRFEILISMLHFSDNENSLSKVQPLLDQFIKNSQSVFTPEEIFCISESLIPIKGNLTKENIRSDPKYGVKIIKLCCNNGYTWNMKVYVEKETNTKQFIRTNIVMELSENLLESGRTVITNNYYTSIDLANKLLDKRTHLIGTIKKNRKGIPQDVIEKKLKKNDIIARENASGITILKWKDQNDVLMLSTKHTDDTITVMKKGKVIDKPTMIIDYDKGKTSLSISDEFTNYGSFFRRTIYKEVAVEIILGTAIINAHFCYKLVTGKTITIIKFRELIIKNLLNLLGSKDSENDEMEVDQDERSLHKGKLRQHVFKKLPGNSRLGRKYCRGCYKKKSAGIIPKTKIRKITTYCNDCEGQPRYCLECFNIEHKNT